MLTTLSTINLRAKSHATLVYHYLDSGCIKEFNPINGYQLLELVS